MELPQPFVNQMRDLLGSETDAFLQALQAEPPVSIRQNPLKQAELAVENAVAWSGYGYYLPQRPVFTLDPLFHAGTYYVQEAASMFVEQAVEQLLPNKEGLNVLDLCAAPGGKSTHLLSLLPADSLLVSNETIRSRANILSENLCKWGCANSVVTNSSAKEFARLSGFFDVILVDAPCSGEGMFRKDPASVSEWSENNVALCAERQQKILADVWPALKDGGLLIYSTCTYNRRENEDNVRWVASELGAESQRLQLQEAWGVSETSEDGVFGYRFFPHHTQSEGFFLAALKKDDTHSATIRRRGGAATKRLPKELDAMRQLVANQNDWQFSTYENKLKAFPANKFSSIEQVEKSMYIISSGLTLGEVKGKDFIPSPALALSTQLNRNAFPILNADLPTALSYLRRDPISASGLPNGYVLVCYNNTPLGWLKNLGNRSNNLYPTEWRIRMEVK